MKLNRWWASRPRERFWLEITDREDLSVDLNAPQRKDDDREFWGYSLIQEVQPGDIVLHYWKPRRGIVGYSRAVGEHWEDQVTWAAHGTSARDAGVSPYSRPGWRLGLEHFTELSRPVTLEMLRENEARIREIRAQLEREVGGALYLPFELSPKRPLRMMQGYLAKFPAAAMYTIPELERVAGSSPRHPVAASDASLRLGVEYRSASIENAVSERDPFSVDPAIVERGIRGHAVTQNALADFVRKRGCDPRSPRPNEPPFDVAWELAGWTFVAEVKSLTEFNEEKQLRLGLGQVLRYRNLLTGRNRRVRAVLAVEHRPRDGGWIDLCKSVEVSLVWPGVFGRIFT